MEHYDGDAHINVGTGEDSVDSRARRADARHRRARTSTSDSTRPSRTARRASCSTSAACTPGLAASHRRWTRVFARPTNGSQGRRGTRWSDRGRAFRTAGENCVVNEARGASQMNAEAVRAEVAKIPSWYHCLDFGNGVVTRGYPRPSGASAGTSSVCRPASPASPCSTSVRGTGFIRSSAERRGPDACWPRTRSCGRQPRPGSSWRGAFSTRKSRTRTSTCSSSIQSASASSTSCCSSACCTTCAIPLLALERVASVTGEHLIHRNTHRPARCASPGDGLLPGGRTEQRRNELVRAEPAMVLAMLKTVGFRRAVIHSGPFKMPTSTRMIFHAWK